MTLSEGTLPGTDALASRRAHQAIRRTFLTVIIAGGAIVLLLSARDLIRQPVQPTWLVLAALTVISGAATLRMRNVPVWFSISDTFTIAAALLFGPSAGAVTVALDALVMSIRMRRADAPKVGVRVLFNATSTALAMWLSAHLFFAFAQSGPLALQPGSIQQAVAPLALFATVYFFLNTGLIAMAVALDRQVSVAAVWRHHFSFLWLTYFGGASIAAILALMTAARMVDVTAIVLILPLILILHVTYRAAIDRVQERVQHLTRIASYAAALRSTADAVLVTDSDGRITLINPAAESLTGWTEQMALGRRGSEVFRTRGPSNGPPAAGTRDVAERTLTEHVLVRAGGTECPIEEMYADIRDDGGQIIGTIRTFRDITRRKASEAEREALLQSEQTARAAADAANRLKDEFLTTLSHELRTPATGILGWARLLKTGRLDEAKTRQALDALERGALAQAALLDDLLDMSRIVRGALPLDLHPIDVRDALAEASTTIGPAMQSKAIDFRVDAAQDVPLVHGDVDRLRQVFWNLLSNAVKFSEPGGTIQVAVRPDAGHVRIEVLDHGSGIRPDLLPYVFDRFRQADGSTTRSHGGLGLGLSIVRHVVELHGGTVDVASEGIGRGARFTVRLPALGARPPSDGLSS